MRRKILLLATVTSIFLISSAGAWWDQGWDYRKPINITEQSGSDLKDYPVKLQIDTSALISAGKMQSDCGDIRFANSTDYRLNYWIEEDCNTASTTIWVELNDLSASSAEKIYMYYNNSGVSSKSNGSAVMSFFDTYRKKPSGFFVQDSGGGGRDKYAASIHQDIGFPQNYALNMRVDMLRYNIDGDGIDNRIRLSSNGGGRVDQFSFQTDTGNGDLGTATLEGDNSVSLGSSSTGSQTWYIRKSSSSSAEGKMMGGIGTFDPSSNFNNPHDLRYYTQSDYNIDVWDWRSSYEDLHIEVGDQSCGSCGDFEFLLKELFVREYTNPEPSYSVGSEETSSFCDRRGSGNECIVDTTKKISGKKASISSTFLSRKSAVFRSFGAQGLISVSNKSVLSGTWEGNINITSNEIVISRHSSFRPDEVIILNERE